MYLCPFLRYKLQYGKQELLRALPITVDCENNWTPIRGSGSVPYSFLTVQREEEIRAEMGFIKAYSQVYSMLIEDMEAEDYDMHQPGRLPPPVTLRNINFGILIKNENLAEEIRLKIKELRSALEIYPFAELLVMESFAFEIPITLDELTERTEHILELYNDVCSLREFYRIKNRFNKQLFK